MTYHQELIDKISDRNQWPSFDRPEHLEQLNQLADEMLEKQTMEGAFASLLIYQQIVEEMIRLLLMQHDFYMQLVMYPAEVKAIKRTRGMFGRLIEDLKNTFTLDESKEEFIDLANQINSVRIELVHGLTKVSTTDDIVPKVRECKTRFDCAFTIFIEIRDSFQLSFKDFKKSRDEWAVEE